MTNRVRESLISMEHMPEALAAFDELMMELEKFQAEYLDGIADEMSYRQLEMSKSFGDILAKVRGEAV